MSSSNGRGGAGGVGGSSEHPQYPKVVLVTGACRFLGGYLTARLAQNPLINRVIAVDAIAPSKDMLRRMGRAEFVRADIRNPFIAKVIRNGEVDTVVHAAAASYAPRSGGSAALKELNVMGAMQLFAACQKAPSVRRVVLKSTSEVYGSSPHDPVMFTEDSSSRRPFSQGFPKDSLDIEGYVRALGRRRPDIAVTILRLANMIGPAMDTTLSDIWPGRWSRRSSAVMRDCSCCTSRMRWVRWSARRWPARPERSTSEPTASSCCRRRSGGPGEFRCRCQGLGYGLWIR
ncbi:UDP-glucose 4-epimerase [Mycobacterium tuberculosis]|nr:UDP-glucose 4-epimerase [Mycobacterium tuberculosis]